MTVSRALNHPHQLKQDTLKRVKKAIQRVGYQPDPVMSALASYRSRQVQPRHTANLAFLDRDRTEYSSLIFEGLKSEALLQGYSAQSHVLPTNPKQQQQLLRILRSRGVQGLIFGPSDEEGILPDWSWQHFAIISLGAIIHQPMVHTICMNYFDGVLSVCRTLLKRGCQRIGFAVEPHLEGRTGHRWLGGYTAALEARNLYIYDRQWPVDKNAFARWCTQNKLDAVLCINHQLASAWPGRAQNFVLLNDSDPANTPEVSRLYLDPKLIGIESIRFIHHLLLRGEYGLPETPKMTEIHGKYLPSTKENKKAD